MTLIEFISPLSNRKHQDRILAVLYYRERYEQKLGLTVEEIRLGLRNSRVKGWAKVNVADVLSKSGPLVDTAGLQEKRHIWNLTDSGREHVRNILNLPKADVEIEHDVGLLENLIKSLSDPDVRDYLEEALICLKVAALRACVVFVWTASIQKIRMTLISKGTTTVTASILKYDSKARTIKNIDDFEYIKDSATLLVAKDLGVLDKAEKDTLAEALGLRNRCGHPSQYRPGIKKVSAFIEDVTSILFT